MYNYLFHIIKHPQWTSGRNGLIARKNAGEVYKTRIEPVMKVPVETIFTSRGHATHRHALGVIGMSGAIVQHRATANVKGKRLYLRLISR